MQFIDEAKIFIKSGNGGNGCVAFRREKFVAKGGPNGGNGGRGASVIFVANSHINTLLNFRYKQHFRAENGEPGRGSNMDGKSKPPMILQVPVGTQILSEDLSLILCDLIQDGQEFEILKGGKGGIGNAHFKSSINQAPRFAIPGQVTEEITVCLQLKLLADVGLVGLPNAGKSTFLSVVSNARPKIADYPFTTLKPHLGMVKIDEQEVLMADIPGLIEGAHLGLGLGDRFLKHIERCKILLHLIDISGQDVCDNYQIVRSELGNYSPLLKDKKEVICLNKIDLLDPAQVEIIVCELRKLSGGSVYCISTATGDNVQNVLYHILENVLNDVV